MSDRIGAAARARTGPAKGRPAFAAIALGLAVAVAPGLARSTDAVKTIALSIVQGRLAGVEDQTVRVRQGDAVVLRWRSDRAIVLHLHGYEIDAKVAQGAAADMAVKARLPGRFPIHEHSADATHNHRPVAYLEVLPGS